MRKFSILAVMLSGALWAVLGGCPRGTNPDPNDPNTTPDPNTSGKPAAFLPSAVALDVSELPEDDDHETLTSQTTRNIYQRVVRSAASVVLRFQLWADRALELAATIRDDMTTTDQSQVAGTFIAGGAVVAYKADFAAFDFDGDGTVDGSGNAVDLPIALRIWVERGSGYRRFACTLITHKPSTENVGAGQVYSYPDAAYALAPDDVHLYVNYDRTDPEHLWQEANVIGTIHPLHVVGTGHARVDVRTHASNQVEKTVRGSFQLTDDLYAFDALQAALHWRVGGSGLLGSATFTGVAGEVGFTNLCVDLDALTLSLGGDCGDLDTQDMTLLPIPTGDPTAFPADFPEVPTF